MEFWERLAAVIDNNPVQEHDSFDMATLKPLGIEKGQPFKPDARQTAILKAGPGGIRQRNPSHGPESDERRGPLLLRRAREERAHSARRPREQLGRDGFAAGTST